MKEATKKKVCTSELYTLRAYSEAFGINYSTVYNRQLMTRLGSETIAEDKKIWTVNINGDELIHVSPKEKEKLLLEKKSKKTK